MKNNGLFSKLFIDELKDIIKLDDSALGRMATLSQTWRTQDVQDMNSLWDTFLKQSLGYLEFVPPNGPTAPGVYPLYEDWDFNQCISVLYLVEPGSDIDDVSVGRFYPAKLIAQLKKRNLNWGILTDGSIWRLYSTKSFRPYEDYVELLLGKSLEEQDEAEYGLFERFFHKDSFIAEEIEDAEEARQDESFGIYKCRLDYNREQSEKVLEERVKSPFLSQVDEVLQYICNGFIFDTKKSGEEYTEEERAEIFESAVKLIYRCLFLFYAEARMLLPSDPDKKDLYKQHSIWALCQEARKFRWGTRNDMEEYDLWKHLKGLINAVNDGDPEYGIMGYNGGLFDDQEERFLGQHQLRNDFLSHALYLLAFVEPYDNEPGNEYSIPYEDLEVRHLGELYENILEFKVQLADTDRFRRRTQKGVEILLASQTKKKTGDALIRKGDVYFGESALERKQTGSYYTPESLVRFLNDKSIVQPLSETFDREYRSRFNEFLEQARDGHDIGAKRGASQSAAALVERFTEEEVLNFKVCDPAMGSGHFLVGAANQMAGLVISILEEVPYVDGMMVSITSCPNNWRRRITRHCIYGVDLNPLAVNLAKLSLWLNCFASDHKLTFLDHHLHCGNSLIGMRTLDQLTTIPKRKKDRKKSDKQKLLFDYNDLSSFLTEAAREVVSINQIDEDDTDSQKAALDEALLAISAVRPLADLYTAYLMDSDIVPEDYKFIFECLAKGKDVVNPMNPALPEILKSIEVYKHWHHFFHWPLAFPDVFGPDSTGGFSAVIGNPPWDIVKPNSQEFFSSYDPKFRSYKKQEANLVSKKLMIDNPSITEKWEEYCGSIAEQSTYFKEPLSYGVLGKGDINTFKLFLEQFFTVLDNNGYMGIVVPSGIYTDLGCQPLRERFFNQSSIEFLYCFENRRAVFNIHRSFKFIALGTHKGGKTDRFKCAFMEHDPERLPAIDANALKISLKQVRKFSPDTLSVMEFKSQRDIDITTKIYGDWNLAGDSTKDTWSLKLKTEIHITNDSSMFNEQGKGYPLFEGKMIHQFDHNYDTIRHWISQDQFNDKARKIFQSKAFRSVRFGFRGVAASTNERTLISTLVPPYVFGEVCLPLAKIDGDNPQQHNLFLSSLLNSFVLDFVIRQKMTMRLSNFYFYQLPIARFMVDCPHYSFIIPRALRLCCTDVALSSLWEGSFCKSYKEQAFWYPESSPIDIYGPVHEQEIRRRLRAEAKTLTSEWGIHCGVHERLTDRRDTGDRAQLRSEIDAYVAHLYGLSRDDFSYILDTFPVLKKKEKKAFGEFMSKRKCIEEYDRLALIVGETK